MKAQSNSLLPSIRRLLALQLWELGAVKINLNDPFKLVSGNFSPIYVNCRRLISFPTFVDIFGAAAREIINQEGLRVDRVAGGETAGIPFAAFLAQKLDRPMVYVRKKVKTYGIANRIEGASVRNQHVLLVEDLITDAGSKLDFIKALTEAGARAKDVLVVFDRLQGGRQALKRRGVRLHTLTDIKMTLAVAEEARLVPIKALRSVRQYLISPRLWHKQRRLNYAD